MDFSNARAGKKKAEVGIYLLDGKSQIHIQEVKYLQDISVQKDRFRINILQ